ncbi:hypothetical protein PHAVU_003G128400 [Phaseolus vulgaris]|uniref:Transmembrane protein n=1 Tax=Phaseolus vulgaris TaxID=3885 RepID=V7CB18_PHAVU|nr:hypothetical protein PHAVU_003G128400g [Phaseolus vulgaris]ESW26548.1 hypothetical protein PHAVU_003G128400g [Phaseolus vulgaris]
MNKVDSPLEAQAFNYLTFAFITLLNSFFTWLAVTFWRIPPPKSEFLPPPDHPILDESDPVAVAEPASVPSPTVVGNGPDVDIDGVRKGKFSFSFYYEGERECKREETVTEEWNEIDGEGEWWERWERLLRMRMGENEKGWYTCQDLAALNGCVVRLWDGGSRFGSRRDSTDCVLLWQ